jgi:hypothetical protein
VEQATAEGVVDADVVTRNGLHALGAGLEDHDPDGWTVHRATANAVTFALAEAAAQHVTVVAEAFTSIAGELSAGSEDLLRGLGYLTIGRGPAEVVAKGLAGWAAASPGTGDDLFGRNGLPAFTVPAAFVAVQEYGQRLAHALHGFEQQAIAEDRSFIWAMTAELIPSLLPDPVDAPVEVIVGYLAMAFGFDGRWSNGVDRGLTFDTEDAVTRVVANLPAHQQEALDQVVLKAREAYQRTLDVMGSPKPPESPEAQWWGPLLDALVPGPDDLLGILGSRRDTFVSPIR